MELDFFLVSLYVANLIVMSATHSTTDVVG